MTMKAAREGRTSPTSMGLGFKIYGLGFRIWGSGVRVQGLGIRV